jgi:hypothetical protein
VPTQPELDDTEIVAAVVLAFLTVTARPAAQPVRAAASRRTASGRRAPALTWSHRRPRQGVGHA